EELLERVWPDSYVEEGVISVNIFMLRKSLAEGDSQTEFIKTVPKQGYRFVAPVEATAEPSGFQRQLPTVDAASKSLAVLPFRWLSADDSGEYLGLGIADALITRLSRIRNLVVRPTSSVRKYTNDTLDAVAIGQQLKVDIVLEGNIRRYGKKLRVSVQLVSVREATPLWADRFDKQFTDIFTVEDSISEQVAEALTLKLSGEEKRQLSKQHTKSAAAYHLYLKGRYFWNKRTEESLMRGREYFHKAIEIDPDYALAYAGLADSYLLGSSRQRPTEVMPKAKASAMRAIEIDDNLSEAHTSLARINMSFDWDWAGAEKEFHQALELNPNYATAHQWYANYLLATGRTREAIREIKEALDLDPLSMSINSAVGWVHYMTREFDEAIAAYERALEMDPTFVLAQREIGIVYEQKGIYAKAVEALQTAIKLSKVGLIEWGFLAHTYAASGSKEEALKVVSQLEPRANKNPVLPQVIAAIYLELADKENALRWLEEAYINRASPMIWLKVDPWFDRLRQEDKFLVLLRRIGLE
ncbi:MAG TPA: tetratricopeptide repeat protein, partial [Candidatus Saccharimonadales bacterium]|nr:tetratricopeptide repeat protein [Candidatus Saccharimonadales bacterium]